MCGGRSGDLLLPGGGHRQPHAQPLLALNQTEIRLGDGCLASVPAGSRRRVESVFPPSALAARTTLSVSPMPSMLSPPGSLAACLSKSFLSAWHKRLLPSSRWGWIQCLAHRYCVCAQLVFLFPSEIGVLGREGAGQGHGDARLGQECVTHGPGSSWTLLGLELKLLQGLAPLAPCSLLRLVSALASPSRHWLMKEGVNNTRGLVACDSRGKAAAMAVMGGL